MTPEQILKLRKKLNLSQEEFAEKIGLKGRFWIGRLENGTKKPSKTILLAIKSLK